MIDKDIRAAILESMREDKELMRVTEPEAPITVDEKLDFLLREIADLKKANAKFLKESNVIPKSATEMYIQIGGKIFKGNMSLVE